ncbi:DUF2267 domain-containing protein [Streptomyces litchfieldiae]|uniref:DUF2267 domain-containing protein n=1 Tax=Streptomyces litchfieldiae TaxID=3075543 RepID=A0ABU2MPM8_9ACTN|nr:DUF2267 domain-containing protein [Streptomyces sp. DSM 44938]MDT0343578.1 DUF2267 domain-containing protein [Streptomyces sp. DSM 44938]
MITHERLVETVADEAGLGAADEAARVARVVLADLSVRLDMPRRQRLRQALPAPEGDAAYAIVPARGDGAPDFVRDIGQHLSAPPERARYLARAVLSSIRAADPQLADDISRDLPPDISELFAPSEGDPARRHPGTPSPAPLTEEELTAALRARPAWTGTTRRLERTVGLPSVRVEPLLRRVRQDTRDMEQSFGHRIGEDEITFILYTGSVDAVTEADLLLADAIDATVSGFGSGG